MALNKLENFIKNTEGRILYVNPNDLDATDSIENQGNSLTKPFKTVQRALLESARFSYRTGSGNDIVEKTTILLFPGEHLIDNRPGYSIGSDGTVYSPSGSSIGSAETVLSLGLTSNFDLTSSDNILYKFNSVYGGVVVPRGTSIVGLELRKTKLRPKYVPNPTDNTLSGSAIFRITGACYFWQFSIFDADANSLVYTDSQDFSSNNQSTPSFSHHKLTCFEYADGVNNVSGYSITDLDMYYAKLSNAFNSASGRDISEKYPANTIGFAKQRPEWEIVGAFDADPITISSILGLDVVATVTTSSPHNLTSDVPIKITGVSSSEYNISTKVAAVTSPTTFTYLLPTSAITVSPTVSNAKVIIETDTVSGASPYIFNVSLRSIWGMNGMHADGRKASGFRSMVVAQFTGVSLQKDDRAFTKYDSSSRQYTSITISKVTGANLPSEKSQASNQDKIYHLDSSAIYRPGWESSHIKASNGAFIQVVSVFAIGFAKHFDVESGGDLSITNSNSNFGQLSLNADGFRIDSFDKDNEGYITSIIPPRAVNTVETDVEWLSLDKINLGGTPDRLYLYGYKSKDDVPPSIVQGYRIGARIDEKLYVKIGNTIASASIYMSNSITISENSHYVTYSASNTLQSVNSHYFTTGEKIRIISDSGDLPENITEHRVYYAIVQSSTEIKIASSESNALSNQYIPINGGSNLKVVSRVSDKNSGELGHPIQWDTALSQWYITTNSSSDIHNLLSSVEEKTDISYIKRFEDSRSLDEKIYKVRYVIPKESTNSRDPVEGFILQESSSTGYRNSNDPTATTITRSDYTFNRNLRFISTCSSNNGTVTVISELPHNLSVGDKVTIRNVTSSTNTSGIGYSGYNGVFTINQIDNSHTFRYSTTDIFGISHNVGTYTNTNIDVTRDTTLPRFERTDLSSNFFIYRNEVIQSYKPSISDGIYHLYILNADNSIPSSASYTTEKYSQNIVNLFPEWDKDNLNDNPQSSVSFAKRNPIGDVITNDLKKSITRESIDKFVKKVGVGHTISSISTLSGTTTLTFGTRHSFGRIISGTLTAGAGYLPEDGTLQNLKLLSGGPNGTWKGATVKATLIGGGFDSAEIMSPGSGYSANEGLYFDASIVGTGNGNARFNITTTSITTNIGDVIQITGIGTVSDGYYRISSVPSDVQVAIAQTSGDPAIIPGQYAINIGPSVTISNSYYVSSTGITTFTCSSSHGLLTGNRFRVLDSSNNNLGDYIVNGTIGVNTFTAYTRKQLTSPTYILKHGLSANDARSDDSGENIGSRAFSIYGNEYLNLVADITSTQSTFSVSVPNSGISTLGRVPLGSYIQIDNEIMRVSSSSFSGVDQIQVIRGVFGTVAESHLAGSIIKKIRPLGFEFRRPSIARASGQTFEYLGYGPGNYSTSLPQVQVRTLTERETFLSQSREKSAGSVIYTGMNSDGDFFVGNTKYSASSGKQVTYDIPVPTVTGDDPTRLSVVFDEVVVKDRLLVEGGTSNTILSQFGGPVTFNKEVKFNDKMVINNDTTVKQSLRVEGSTESTTKDTGALVIADGGLGVEGNVNIGKNLNVSGIATLGIATLTNLTVGGNLKVTGITTLGITTVSGTFNVSGVSTFNSNVNVGAGASFIGNGTVPVGTIVMWSGANVPVGWATCNGQTVNGIVTPDLRDRFIVGSGSAYTIGNTGGSNTILSSNLNIQHNGNTIVGFTTNNFNAESNFVCTRDANVQSYAYLIGNNGQEATFTLGSNGSTNLPVGTFNLIPGIEYDVVVPSGSTRINPTDNKTLDIDDGAPGPGEPDWNDLKITPTKGRFIKYTNSGVIKFIIDYADVVGLTTTTTNVAVAGTENRPPYYALAYIMRIQ